MKYSIYYKAKFVLASTLTSLIAFLVPSNARATDLLIDRKIANEMGLEFDTILTTFKIAGIIASEEGVVLTNVYEETNEVELTSLDGFTVCISLDRIVSGASDIPRNFREN